MAHTANAHRLRTSAARGETPCEPRGARTAKSTPTAPKCMGGLQAPPQVVAAPARQVGWWLLNGNAT
eukprot:8298338-Lingulodinium_polyedra.AAC.1